MMGDSFLWAEQSNQPPCVRTVKTHRGFLRSKASWMGRLRPLNFVHEATLSMRKCLVKEISEGVSVGGVQSSAAYTRGVIERESD